MDPVLFACIRRVYLNALHLWVDAKRHRDEKTEILHWSVIQSLDAAYPGAIHKIEKELLQKGGLDEAGKRP